MNSNYEILILGAGPAGLGAAMSLGRMSRSVLICDDDRPRNAPAEHMNNFPSHDGLNPREWRKKAQQDLETYKTIHFLSASVLYLKRESEGFSAEFSDGSKGLFRKIILAHGLEDRFSDVPGHRELWGKSIYHCPYCHGYEVKGKRLGLVVNTLAAEHLLPMILSLSADTMLFTNGPIEISREFQNRIRAKGIRVVEDKIQSLLYEGDVLKTVVFSSGEKIERDGLFWIPNLPYSLKSDLGVKLGCELTEIGLYKVNELGKTTVDGVFAAGDVSKPMHSVLIAAAAGQLAGAAATAEILSENFAK